LPENLRRVIGSWWTRLAITVGILLYLASRIDMTASMRAVVRVDPGWLAAVLVLVACDRAVMIWRWVLLLRASRVPVRGRDAARIFLISSFVGSFLPAGVGGDLARAYGLSRATRDGSEAIASVAVDRVLGVMALVVMGIAGLLATATAIDDWRVTASLVLLIAACAALLWADRLFAQLLPARVRAHRLGGKLAALGDALSRYRGRPGALAQVFAWSVGVQLLRIVQAYCLGLGLGLGVPFRYYLVFMPVGLLMLLLPISVSGFGLPQAMIVWLMQPLGVADEQSLALSTLIVLTGLAGNLPGLLLWISRNRANTVKS
jgi:glycosyltransferase 2 family protein